MNKIIFTINQAVWMSEDISNDLETGLLLRSPCQCFEMNVNPGTTAVHFRPGQDRILHNMPFTYATSPIETKNLK